MKVAQIMEVKWWLQHDGQVAYNTYLVLPLGKELDYSEDGIQRAPINGRQVSVISSATSSVKHLADK